MIDLGPDIPLWLSGILAVTVLLGWRGVAAAKVIKEFMPSGSADRKELGTRFLSTAEPRAPALIRFVEFRHVDQML
ncbi:hypothetical protein [Nonomuraea sp. NEAU-A123]|uniref:hypothetical protein n=1 Tax=Nonomuraea sp. NEAU-A123 TaxID=2839649 RepID=UPI001BE4497F|nr:hypothetical protein [Nonomuraea sp. NEAU-A123]MBT2230519.1 hypothetical protein [Nonomuraea sp. NEAU-A123]